MFALLIAVATLALLRQRRYVLAGVVLALAAYKPNILAVLAFACFIRYHELCSASFQPLSYSCCCA